MNNLEGVKSIVNQSLGYVEENMRLPPAKASIRAPYIGDKGSNIESAKELLYGTRSKKH